MRVLVIPDLHCPYNHPGARRFITRLIANYKPHVICNLGDELDCHGWSRFPKSPGAMGSVAELENGAAELHRIFDGHRVFFCNSNHIARAEKRIAEAGIPSAFMRQIGEVINAPRNWRWADVWEWDGVQYQHGDGYNGQNAALLASLDNGKPTVIGHLHGNAGVTYRNTRSRMFWGMHVGCLVDPRAPVFEYGKHSRFKPCLGAATVTNGVPQWFPL